MTIILNGTVLQIANITRMPVTMETSERIFDALWAPLLFCNIYHWQEIHTPYDFRY